MWWRRAVAPIDRGESRGRTVLARGVGGRGNGCPLAAAVPERMGLGVGRPRGGDWESGEAGARQDVSGAAIGTRSDG